MYVPANPQMIPVANIPIPNPAIEPEKEDEMYLTLFWWAIVNFPMILYMSNLSYVTFQWNSEIWSHKTGGLLIKV